MPPRRLPRLPSLTTDQAFPRVNGPLLALGAVAAHGAAIGLLDPGSADIPRRFLLVGGYLLGLAFVWRNRRFRAMQVLAVGLVLNLLPVIANSGLMPVTPAKAEVAGLTDRPGQVLSGEPIPHSKDILLEKSSTRLAPLTDTIVLPAWLPGRGVASVGDVVIVIAIATGLAAAALGAAMKLLNRSNKQPPAQAAYAHRNM